MKEACIVIFALFLAGCESSQPDRRTAMPPADQQISTHDVLQPFRNGRFAAMDWDTSMGEIANQLPAREQLIALQQQDTNEEDQPDLDVSLGLLYSQITGYVNFTNAAVYFNKALQYDLPPRIYIEVVFGRGNCEEELHEQNEALMDYLRSLLACSYYDLSTGWSQILSPAVPLIIDSDDPENEQRIKDYNLYRRRLNFQQFVLMERYYLIEAVKRVQGEGSDDQIQRMLQALTPDNERCKMIMGWLNSENKRPWP